MLGRAYAEHDMRDQRIALDDCWQARMTQDPSSRAEWQAHADGRVAEVRGRR